MAVRVWLLASSRQPITASAASSGGRPQPQRRPAPSLRTRGGQDRPLSSTPAAGAAAVAAEAHQPAVHTPLQRLSRYRALLLDSTYRPVGVANWQRAICLDLMEKADVLEYYDQSVCSVQLQMYLPAVLRVRWHARNPNLTGRVSLNRSNIMLRDRYSCQYCGSGKELTIDHVVPQSKGGQNTWTNLVACCASCNSRKGDKSLEQLRWKLRQQPKEPSMHEMEFVLAMLLGHSTSQEQLPEEWAPYIVPFSRSKKKKQQQ